MDHKCTIKQKLVIVNVKTKIRGLPRRSLTEQPSTIQCREEVWGSIFVHQIEWYCGDGIFLPLAEFDHVFFFSYTPDPELV